MAGPIPSKSKKYKPKLTDEQKDIMVTFMEENIGFFRCSKNSQPVRHEDGARLWQILAAELNACFGPRKSETDWRKCWQDLKRTALDKASRIRQEEASCVPGANYKETLTPLQERIVALVGRKRRRHRRLSHQLLPPESPSMVVSAKQETNSSDFLDDTTSSQPLEGGHVMPTTSFKIAGCFANSRDANVDPQTSESLEMIVPVSSPLLESCPSPDPASPVASVGSQASSAATSCASYELRVKASRQQEGRPTALSSFRPTRDVAGDEAKSSDKSKTFQAQKLELQKALLEMEIEKWKFMKEMEKSKLELKERKVMALESIARSLAKRPPRTE